MFFIVVTNTMDKKATLYGAFSNIQAESLNKFRAVETVYQLSILSEEAFLQRPDAKNLIWQYFLRGNSASASQRAYLQGLLER